MILEPWPGATNSVHVASDVSSNIPSRDGRGWEIVGRKGSSEIKSVAYSNAGKTLLTIVNGAVPL